MRILYAIQGTGNGHVTRARDIIPILKEQHEVDVLISGRHTEVALPYDIKYRFQGLGFVFGKKGGIDLMATYKNNKIRILLEEINSLPVEEYDLVINDFEPVSAWACAAKNVKCISLSHQAAVLNKYAPQPQKIDIVGRTVLKKYAPTDAQYGFHFKPYDKQIFTPVIRQEIRSQRPVTKDHYTVYLPAYDDKRIIKVLSLFKDVKWEVFSKHNKQTVTENNITIQPIDNEAFIKSMAGCIGVLCGAGFETPAEALFMKKKLLVIPMKGQYEQQCNAAALKEMGVPVIKKLSMKNAVKIKRWLSSEKRIAVSYPDATNRIITKILLEHSPKTLHGCAAQEVEIPTAKKFRSMIFKKIIAQL
ncbi:MAG: glycosyl transferase [Sphingobacteriales bacterium]|nr:MAG: glycosyl transferase [Sphingobacteriales bacterium]